MTVNELTDLLATYIAAGRGSDQVFVGLRGTVIDNRMQDILDRHNWEVVDVDPADGRSSFIQLNAEPQR